MSKLLPCILAVLLLIASCADSSGKEITIPITLDYELLNGLLIQTSYTDPGQTAQLLNEGNGCVELRLADPQFSGEAEVLTLHTDVYIHLGTPLGDNCLMPYQWNGSIQVAQIPQLDSRNWDLSFQTVDTTLFSADGTVIESFDMVFKRLLPLINQHMQEFSITLANPVEDLRTFILPMFTADAREEAEQLLNSIRPGAIIANEKSLVVNIHADAIQLDSPPDTERVETLSEEEMEDFLDLWETYDSLLVFLVSILSENPLSPTDRQQLIDLLLVTRYEFVSRINDTSVEKDFVRDQFLAGWELLSAIFRNQLLAHPAESRIGYLSFLTAGDALRILDELGPAFGIEISRNGLIRLAKILGGETVELHYSPDINKALQMLFQVYPETQENGSEEEQKPAPAQETSDYGIWNFLESVLIGSALAATQPSFTEIKRWQTPKNNFDDYLERIKDLLDFAYTSLVIRRELTDNFTSIYQAMIPAIAWQESCFKQFVVKDSKLTYLLSYNNSSVGLMQVNERVWRGIYDTQRLRWDIQYNAAAGCEIVDLYLQKYALRKYGSEILNKTDTLAQLVYAMYNGGPSQYDKFLKRSQTNELYESDRLFAQKYEWVKNGQWQQVEKCF